MIPVIMINDYLGFFMKFHLAAVILFQVPLVFAVLGLLEIVPVETLAKARPYYLLGSLILAAVLTPPDVVSQVMIALPMYVLYEVALIMVRILLKAKKVVRRKK